MRATIRTGLREDPTTPGLGLEHFQVTARRYGVPENPSLLPGHPAEAIGFAEADRRVKPCRAVEADRQTGRQRPAETV